MKEDKELVKYFVRCHPSLDWQEVTLEQYCEVERACGFHPKPGCGPTATGSFGYGPIGGRQVYLERDKYSDWPKGDEK